MRLDRLKKGQAGKVFAVNCGQKTKNRLLKMGLNEGARVEFIRTSPLGDPLEIKVRDFYMAIRKSAASKIEVTLARNEPDEPNGQKKQNEPDGQKKHDEQKQSRKKREKDFSEADKI